MLIHSTNNQRSIGQDMDNNTQLDTEKYCISCGESIDNCVCDDDEDTDEDEEDVKVISDSWNKFNYG